MTKSASVGKNMQNDSLNYLLTNKIPRRLAGQVVGRISHSTNPLVRIASLWAWRRFTTIDLSDAAHSRFDSMHALFTRRLRPGARPIEDPVGGLTSPCDGIIGATGLIENGRALQIKGMDYALAELLDDQAAAEALEGCRYVTLRLTSAMYHRFHAPCDVTMRQVRHVFGDRWNVNPPTLKRVARLFCRNERVVLHGRTPDGSALTLVAVAAILVSGIRLGFLTLDTLPDGMVRRVVMCAEELRRGDEIGWFEHGSTIIVLCDGALDLAPGVCTGSLVRMGQTLLRRQTGREASLLE